MVTLVNYDAHVHADALQALWTAHYEAGAGPLKDAVGFEEDIPAEVARDVAHADRFRAPDGRLLLAVDGDEVLGCGAMRLLEPGVAEIKRMFLYPEARGKGIGRALLDELLATARRMGCHEARLDTGWYMTDAHRLYQAAGFEVCAPYPGSEVPPELTGRWTYMRLELTPVSS